MLVNIQDDYFQKLYSLVICHMHAPEIYFNVTCGTF